MTLPSPEEVRPWVEAIIRLWDDDADRDRLEKLAASGADLWNPIRLQQEYVRIFQGITIGLPTTGAGRTVRSKCVALVSYLHDIEPECHESLRMLELERVEVVRCRGSSAIDLARNMLASEALHRGYEKLIFIDADVKFDPADALRLLARPEPVIAGVYPKKGVRELASTFKSEIREVTFGRDAPGLYPLEHAATGFLKIHTETLRLMISRLELPLCNTSKGGGFWPFFLPCVVPSAEGHTYLAEDWSFSWRLRQIGVTPMADTSVRLHHLGSYGYSWEDVGPPLSRYQRYTYRFTPSSNEETDTNPPDAGIE